MINYPVKMFGHTLDPHHLEYMQEIFLTRQLHRGLMKFTSDLKVSTDIASKVDVTNDGKTYIFTLRDEKFEDGSTLVAADVVSTFRRLFSEKSSMAADFFLIKGGRAALKNPKLADKIAVTTVSKNQVKFELIDQSALFLIQLCLVDSAIFKAIKTSSGETEFMGLGPYVVKVVSHEETMLVPRLEGKSEISAIRLLKIESDETAYQMAIKGELDSLEGYKISENQFNNLKAIGWQKTVTSASGVIYMILNPNRISEKNRIALRRFVEQVDFKGLPSGFSRLYGLIPNIFPGAMAKPTGTPIVTAELPKQFEIKVEGTSENSANLAAELKQILHNSDITLTTFPTESYLKILERADFDAIFVSKGLEYPDGLSLLSYFKSNLKSNFYFVKSKYVDKAIEAASKDPVASSRVQRYLKIQEAILNENTLIPIISGSSNLGLWSGKVSGIEPHPLGPATLDFSKFRKIQ